MFDLFVDPTELQPRQLFLSLWLQLACRKIDPTLDEETYDEKMIALFYEDIEAVIMGGKAEGERGN